MCWYLLQEVNIRNNSYIIVTSVTEQGRFIKNEAMAYFSIFNYIFIKCYYIFILEIIIIRG